MKMKLNKLTTFPKKGEIFGAKLTSLCVYDSIRTTTSGILTEEEVAEVYNRDKNEFPYCFSTTISKVMSIEDDHLILLKYLGEGKCEEYYTSKIINIKVSPAEISETSEEEAEDIQEAITDVFKERYADYREFSKSYKHFHDYPMIINYSSSNSLLYQVDGNFMVEFSKNQNKEADIINCIERIECQSQVWLQEDYKKIADIDYSFAYTEDAIKTLEKKK